MTLTHHASVSSALRQLRYLGSTVVKNLPASEGDARDSGSIPGSRKFCRVGNVNPLQYSCLDRFMDRGAWQATVHEIVKSRTWLSTHSRQLEPSPFAQSPLELLTLVNPKLFTLPFLAFPGKKKKQPYPEYSSHPHFCLLTTLMLPTWLRMVWCASSQEV